MKKFRYAITVKENIPELFGGGSRFKTYFATYKGDKLTEELYTEIHNDYQEQVICITKLEEEVKEEL